MLGLALGVARLADDAASTIHLRDATLTTATGDAHAVQLCCDDGSGHGTLAMDAETFQRATCGAADLLPGP